MTYSQTYVMKRKNSQCESKIKKIRFLELGGSKSYDITKDSVAVMFSNIKHIRCNTNYFPKTGLTQRSFIY
jgi:hypothetical protein